MCFLAFNQIFQLLQTKGRTGVDLMDIGIQQQFGANLKKLRERNGLSLRDLAALCELDDSKISKIENGRFNIQLSTIFELSKGLNLKPKELLDF